jgi:muconolactone D-isomerase
MRFLLNIQVRLPGEWTQDQRADLVRRETEAAVELMHRKVLRRTFRVVGQLANFSIWETPTPEELHTVLQSLPMYPFMTIAVTPIIKHPVERAYEEKHGAIPPLQEWRMVTAEQPKGVQRRRLMRVCPNTDCPDRVRLGLAGEYVDSVEVCPTCGTRQYLPLEVLVHEPIPIRISSRRAETPEDHRTCDPWPHGRAR